MFVEKTPVAVCVDPATVPEPERNVIYIRPKMDYGTKQRVQSAAAHITPGLARAGLDDLPLDMAAWNLALLVYNITSWQGPAFADVPCDAAHIEGLDPDEPLLDAVLAAIQARNFRAESDADPNGPRASTPAGARPSPAPSRTPTGRRKR